MEVIKQNDLPSLWVISPSALYLSMWKLVCICLIITCRLLWLVTNIHSLIAGRFLLCSFPYSSIRFFLRWCAVLVSVPVFKNMEYFLVYNNSRNISILYLDKTTCILIGTNFYPFHRVGFICLKIKYRPILAHLHRFSTFLLCTVRILDSFNLIRSLKFSLLKTRLIWRLLNNIQKSCSILLANRQGFVPNKDTSVTK